MIFAPAGKSCSTRIATPCTIVWTVWFDQAVTGRPLKDRGVAPTPDASFDLTPADNFASVQAAFRKACASSRRTAATLDLGDEVTGRGSRAAWALYVQVLRELTHHHGHADILREQILAARPA